MFTKISMEQLLADADAVPLLKSLHILTRDGNLNQDSARKLKQVLHLCNFFNDVFKDVVGNYGAIPQVIVDQGAGKSYLGFLLHYFFFKKNSPHKFLSDEALALCKIYSVEERPELIEKSKALANDSHAKEMHFIKSSIQHAALHISESVHLVTALHACDLATDHAIEFGLQKQSYAFVLVPCCQAEIASLLRKNKNIPGTEEQIQQRIFWKHALHTREFGSHLTNVLRCLWLESEGYQVTVTELVGWEHSLKNELIIAKKIGDRSTKLKARLLALLQKFQIDTSELRQRYGLS